MNSGWISGVATAVLLLCFIGIVVWSFSSRRKQAFEKAARLPLEEDTLSADREVRP